MSFRDRVRCQWDALRPSAASGSQRARHETSRLQARPAMLQNRRRRSSHDQGLRHVQYPCPGACTAYPLFFARALYLYTRSVHFVCAFVRRFVEAEHPCLRTSMLCLRWPLCVCALHLLARVFPVPARLLCLAACTCLPCPCAFALSCVWSTYSIKVSSPTPLIVLTHQGKTCTSSS